MNIYSQCPFSINPIDFQIIYLIRQEIIITEIYMDYGGYQIQKFDYDKMSNVYEVSLRYFYQLTNALKYMECFKIATNEIKNANVLIDNFSYCGIEII